ncbi:MAG: Hsp20/alpha crystallin family protein [Patescibacteria group bacterium]
MTKLPRYDPFRHWLAWPRWMDEWKESSAQRGFKIKETDKNIVAEAVVAGVPADDVKVRIEDGFLTTKDKYQSSSYQNYHTAALSGGAWDKAKADVEDGVIKVTIPIGISRLNKLK